MSVFGIAMVRDEDDIIGYTLPRMAAQVDGVIIANNLSTDGTSTILNQLSHQFGNITVVEDTEPAYTQSQKMSALAQLAREEGADMIVPFDADEVWCSPSGSLKEVLEELPRHFSVALATLYNHVVTGLDDSSDPNPISRICWRHAEPLSLPKAAARILPGLVIEQGNHGAHYPGPVLSCTTDIIVHHYPYRSVEQMVRKTRNGAGAYRAAIGRTPPGAGQHWTDHDRLTDEQIEEVFTEWYYSVDAEGLISDPPAITRFHCGL